MKCSGKNDATWTIPRSIAFSPLHFMLYRGKTFSLRTVYTVSANCANHCKRFPLPPPPPPSIGTEQHVLPATQKCSPHLLTFCHFLLGISLFTFHLQVDSHAGACPLHHVSMPAKWRPFHYNKSDHPTHSLTHSLTGHLYGRLCGHLHGRHSGNTVYIVWEQYRSCDQQLGRVPGP